MQPKISSPFTNPFLITGFFSGKLIANINKKDLDFGITLYEVLPSGEYFHLPYIISRASYTKNISKRNLLKPHKKETILFSNSHFVAKKIQKGSRLLVHLNINKNPFSPIKYGTRKKVMDETILDANEPLKIKWYTNSFIEIPIETICTK
ncbi:hypothetical protein OAT18_02585 [Tenacibaculum sp.]|nr:hypothetical protein [Tenacibaculum sp.]